MKTIILLHKKLVVCRKVVLKSYSLKIIYLRNKKEWGGNEISKEAYANSSINPKENDDKHNDTFDFDFY